MTTADGNGGANQEAARVVVVGAGVSGCACAASLAETGVAVTLVNPSLDHVGEPSCGAELSRGTEGARRTEEVLTALPVGVGKAWRSGLLVDNEGGMRFVDRRSVSLGVKRALESMAGLKLRQGHVSGVQRVDGRAEAAISGPAGGRASGVWISTVFGEKLWADAVVIAVGLALDGSVDIDGTCVGAGRYGQPASTGLLEDLRDMGARTASTEVRVAPLVGTGRSEEVRGEPAVGGEEGRSRAKLDARVRAVSLERAARRTAEERDGLPPSPYDDESLWARSACVLDRSDGSQGGANVTPLLWPDGLATREMGVAAEAKCGPRAKKVPGWWQDGAEAVSRPGYVVRGAVVTNLREGGLLDIEGAWGLPVVWVTGSAAGAHDYLESLLAGMGTGRAVAEALGAVGSGGSSGC